MLALLCPVRWFRAACALFQDHYKVMELGTDATPAQIKEAYYRLSKIYHPDKNLGDETAEKFKALTAAYEVLGDNHKKTLYDLDRLTYPHGSPQYRYPGNAEYRGGPRRDPTRDGADHTYQETEYQEWLRRQHGGVAYTADKRPQSRGYQMFWYTFWGGLVFWISVTIAVFFSDTHIFGNVQKNMRNDFYSPKNPEKMKELSLEEQQAVMEMLSRKHDKSKPKTFYNEKDRTFTK